MGEKVVLMVLVLMVVLVDAVVVEQEDFLIELLDPHRVIHIQVLELILFLLMDGVRMAVQEEIIRVLHHIREVAVVVLLVLVLDLLKEIMVVRVFNFPLLSKTLPIP